MDEQKLCVISINKIYYKKISKLKLVSSAIWTVQPSFVTPVVQLILGVVQVQKFLTNKLNGRKCIIQFSFEGFTHYQMTPYWDLE